jgi:acyl carrier protein
MSAVFQIPFDSITDEDSPDTIELWDSLKHMYLVAAFEEEFDLEFSDEEIGEMMNVQLIKNIIEDKAGNSNSVLKSDAI